jgi:hypothetical protein
MLWIYVLRRLVLLAANRLADDDRSRIVIVYGVLAAVVLVQFAFIKPLDSYTKPIGIICVLELLAFDLFCSSGKASGTIQELGNSCRLRFGTSRGRPMDIELSLRRIDLQSPREWARNYRCVYTGVGTGDGGGKKLNLY